MTKLADTIEALAKKHRAPWYVVKVPRDYSDGTSHFTLVRAPVDNARDSSGTREDTGWYADFSRACFSMFRPGFAQTRLDLPPHR
jgi:hypothetical protein